MIKLAETAPNRYEYGSINCKLKYRSYSISLPVITHHKGESVVYLPAPVLYILFSLHITTVKQKKSICETNGTQL